MIQLDQCCLSINGHTTDFKFEQDFREGTNFRLLRRLLEQSAIKVALNLMFLIKEIPCQGTSSRSHDDRFALKRAAINIGKWCNWKNLELTKHHLQHLQMPHSAWSRSTQNECIYWTMATYVAPYIYHTMFERYNQNAVWHQDIYALYIFINLFNSIIISILIEFKCHRFTHGSNKRPI